MVSLVVPVVVVGALLSSQRQSLGVPRSSNNQSLVGVPVGTIGFKPLRQPPAPPPRAVGELGQLLKPQVFVRSSIPITDAQLRMILLRTEGVGLLISTGKITLGSGSVFAIGVDPSTFRAHASADAAVSTPLWESVARGEIAIAHSLGSALGLEPGHSTSVAAAAQNPYEFRVGALATTGLPGVGMVVDDAYDQILGLAPRTGLIISSSQRDPTALAAVVDEVLTGNVVVQATDLIASDSGRGSWVAPAVGPLTSPFGPRVAPREGASTNHKGIDISGPLGADIWAASAGVVSYAGPAAGYGNEVIISHAGGVQTVYGHMQTILVTPGESVRAGQVIALLGSEGVSTGPHLHFEVHVSNSPIDPEPWLYARGVTVFSPLGT